MSTTAPAEQTRIEWLTQSTAIGRQTLPAMHKLTHKVPGLTAAILCTLDGFNLCALGMNEDSVHRIAAVSSTLCAISASAVREFAQPDGTEDNFDMLSLTAHGLQIVGIRVPFRLQNELVLLVAARNAMIGAIMAGARSTAHEIQALLAQPLDVAR